MSKDLVAVVHDPHVSSKIYLIRGKRIMIDSDIAELYGVQTKFLNLAVRRNPNRFPHDFMFQLTLEETESLRLQFATSKKVHGGLKKIRRFMKIRKSCEYGRAKCEAHHGIWQRYDGQWGFLA